MCNMPMTTMCSSPTDPSMRSWLLPPAIGSGTINKSAMWVTWSSRTLWDSRILIHLESSLATITSVLLRQMILLLTSRRLTSTTVKWKDFRLLKVQESQSISRIKVGRLSSKDPKRGHSMRGQMFQQLLVTGLLQLHHPRRCKGFKITLRTEH